MRDRKPRVCGTASDNRALAMVARGIAASRACRGDGTGRIRSAFSHSHLLEHSGPAGSQRFRSRGARERARSGSHAWLEAGVIARRRRDSEPIVRLTLVDRGDCRRPRVSAQRCGLSSGTKYQSRGGCAPRKEPGEGDRPGRSPTATRSGGDGVTRPPGAQRFDFRNNDQLASASRESAAADRHAWTMTDLSRGRILVTGGAGFIGSALVWELNRRGITDVLISDFLGEEEKWRNLVPLRFADYIEADDLLLRLDISPHLFKDITAIFHLGACSSTTESNAAYLIRNNFEYTK